METNLTCSSNLALYFWTFLTSSSLRPSTVIAWETDKELSEVSFAAIDTTGNGQLDFGEVSTMAESIALSADTDENQSISLEEFIAWDFDYAYLTERDGSANQYA